ncbi:MAG: lipoyl(octanoyl) transferase LipB [Armatimonadetes bacterium]|nr:lipoyl(octanoyl) transferase LipB [Armatimonadota bacterium]
MTLPPCVVVEAGLVPYPEAERRQRELLKRRRAGEIPDTLLLLEHPEVVTVGRGATDAADWVNLAALRARGVEVLHVARGGLATYHAPGQLVGYPILNLRELRTDLHWYLRSLERVLIEALGELGCPARRREGFTGVWVGRHKVASIGVAVRGWVTWHGFALNVNCHTPLREALTPCGLSSDVMASLDELMDTPPEMGAVSEAVAECFCAVFGRRLVRAEMFATE